MNYNDSFIYKQDTLPAKAKVATAVDFSLHTEGRKILQLIQNNNDITNSLKAISQEFPHIRIEWTRLNDYRHINKTLIAHNKAMNPEDCLLCHFTPYPVVKERMKQSMPRFLYYLCFVMLYLWKRVCPKVSGLKTIYYGATQGKNRSLHQVEVLGRIYRAGFEIIFTEIVNDEFYAYICKKSEPLNIDKANVGPIIQMRRIGYQGKLISIYKMRTMYAFSEYLQAFVYEHSKLMKGDKIADDYRITPLGSFLRKFWLDELPQIINLIKGDIKLVGVRPISQHKYSLYSKEAQECRIKVKPGIIPPYYVDLPKSLQEMEESECRYTEAYLKHPFITDWIYFGKAIVNIVFKGARSK